MAVIRKPFSPYSFGLFILALALAGLGAFIAVRWTYPDFAPALVIAGFVPLFLGIAWLKKWGAKQGYASCPSCDHQASHPGLANEYVSPIKYRPQRRCNNCGHDLTQRLPVEP